MELLYTYLFASLVIFVYMSIAFLISLVLKKADIADVAWGFGFIVLAISSYFYQNHQGVLPKLTLLLLVIWGVRLSLHILIRNCKKEEDARYVELKKGWEKSPRLNVYLKVFMLQGAILLLLAFPIVVINTYQASTISILFAILGTLVWLVGFAFEVVSDRQLALFQKNKENKGKILQTGLFSYSRHPNYFGEILIWAGIWILSITLPFSIIAVISPLTLTFLILKVSGIPLKEAQLSKKEGFETYQKEVSLLIPRRRKQSGGH